ncbi:MAG: tRNA pseudouridine synthase A [Saprospiraceae bacterium]|nr:tRNA pseudouridine synthase A [Saprospiraceae bacterium]
MRYFIHLAYLGTAYHGWQRQANATPCIQQILEEVLLKMTSRTISLTGCGRTDAGVHASQFFCHFDYEEDWNFDPVDRLNHMLPRDISVFEIIPVEKSAHSRYDAIRRTYEYHLHKEANPFFAPVSTYYNSLGSLNFGLMREAMIHLEQQTDFRHLCLTPNKYKNTVCSMYESTMRVSDNEKQICFTFTANRFLKSMIRIMVSRLLALGQGLISLDEFKDDKKNNQSFSIRPLARPEGLHLTRVVYPYLERDPKSIFKELYELK